MRISVDTKATVNLGEYSRGGKSRGLEAIKALDHDGKQREIDSRWPIGARQWSVFPVFWGTVTKPVISW
ncbi:hypothetical protein [Methylomonas lenta]|uniref:hypothetical protein n=1 Tax=Methylomonas lenta TaxID=980561 RepID=UPI0038B6B9CB